MYKVHRVLARRLAKDVAADEVLADLAFEEAAQADRLGDNEKAEILRDLGRRHRAHAIQQDARMWAFQAHATRQFEH
ncbi:hypothetical protein [Methylobacterium komagatae]